jgi:hypothetical protein
MTNSQQTYHVRTKNSTHRILDCILPNGKLYYQLDELIDNCSPIHNEFFDLYPYLEKSGFLDAGGNPVYLNLWRPLARFRNRINLLTHSYKMLGARRSFTKDHGDGAGA